MIFLFLKGFSTHDIADERMKSYLLKWEQYFVCIRKNNTWNGKTKEL